MPADIIQFVPRPNPNRAEAESNIFVQAVVHHIERVVKDMPDTWCSEMNVDSGAAD